MVTKTVRSTLADFKRYMETSTRPLDRKVRPTSTSSSFSSRSTRQPGLKLWGPPTCSTGTGPWWTEAGLPRPSGRATRRRSVTCSTLRSSTRHRGGGAQEHLGSSERARFGERAPHTISVDEDTLRQVLDGAYAIGDFAGIRDRAILHTLRDTCLSLPRGRYSSRRRPWSRYPTWIPLELSPPALCHIWPLFKSLGSRKAAPSGSMTSPSGLHQDAGQGRARKTSCPWGCRGGGDPGLSGHPRLSLGLSW